MDNVTRCLIATLALELAAPAIGQQIYKWVDDRGVTHYTTTPPPGGKAQPMKVQPPPAAKPAAGAKSWQEQEAEFRARQVEREEAQRKQEQAERGAAQRRAACASAQRDLRIVQEQSRIFTLDEKGERQYMEDAQRAEIARKARAFLDQECQK